MAAVESHLDPFPLRAAMEAKDAGAAVAAFAPDAVLHSPLTGGLSFTGHEQITAVTEVVLDVFEDFHYTDEVRGRDSTVLVARARVGGQDIEIVDHLRMRPDGKIGEMTVFFRPLPATAVALRLIAGGLARRKSPARAVLLSVMARPLAFFTRTGDGLGVRLIRASLRPAGPYSTGVAGE
jgi:hypothetical protein